MRRYSFFTILLLCLAILSVDFLAYYWLQTVTELISSNTFKTAIDIVFWIFTIGLITAIMVLKLRLDAIDAKYRNLWVTSLYGLTVSSFIPKFIFVLIISILYFTNYSFTGSESRLLIPLMGLLSGFLPFFVIAYGIFRALYRFKVYNITIKLDKIPKGFNTMRVVHISDLHLGNFNFRYHILERAVKTINHLKPDFIFFTGDLVNNFAWELKGWDTVFKNLSAKFGKYAVLGNHDYGDYSEWSSVKAKQENFESIKDFYKKIDFKLLSNETEIIENEDDKLGIIGVENWGKPPFKQYGDLQKSMKNVDNEMFKILLSHDPTHWSEEVVTKSNIDLTLSGHTHGMQAAIVLKNKKWSPIKYKYEHWAGLYTKAKQHLYVNRGLGWVGFPGRIGVRPEITFLELKNK